MSQESRSSNSLDVSTDYGQLKRDAGVFSALYRDSARDVLTFFARRTCDPEIAADLMAETFAKAFLGRRRFRGSTYEEARAWLFGIAHRRLAMYIRRGKAERRALRRLGLEPPSLEDAERARIEELMDLDDVRAMLRQQLGSLVPAQRAALELRVVEELPYSDVAKRLGVSEQAARARVSRALRTLGSALDGTVTAEV